MCAYDMRMIFCFKQKTAYDMRISDWSSDVSSSDLCVGDMLLDLVRGDAETGRDRSEILVAEEIRQENLTRDFRQRGDRTGVSVNRRSADVDRQSVVAGKRVSVRVGLGGRLLIKTTKMQQT